MLEYFAEKKKMSKSEYDEWLKQIPRYTHNPDSFIDQMVDQYKPMFRTKRQFQERLNTKFTDGAVKSKTPKGSLENVLNYVYKVRKEK